MMHRYKSFILLPLICLSLNIGKLHAQIAVVVNRDHPSESIKISKLNRIFLGEIIKWENESITLVDHKHKSKTTKTFFNRVCGLSQSKVRLKWLGKMLNGDFQTLPVKLASDAEILKFVSENPGAIGFVKSQNLGRLHKLVKVIKIDGKPIDDPKYPIR
ncbi:substrate-binding domain-containing protein [candidate division KSB1 bacterium]|nr:substrate-binding domain-containing protein [candidate division KSB1 bacterium]